MTKLRHENPPHWGPDAGAVRSVPDHTRPFKHVTEAEKARRHKERAEELRARGEAIRRAELEAFLKRHDRDRG